MTVAVIVPNAVAAGAPYTVHRQFRSEGRFTALLTNGRDIAFFRSGTAIRLRRAGGGEVTLTAPCNPKYSPVVLDESFLMVDCGHSAALYGLADRQWRTVAITPTADCAAASDCSATPNAVGARWLRVDEQWDCMFHGCATATEYVDILTGQLAPANATASVRVGGDQTIDLDSPTLVRTLCSPLRQPAGAVYPDGRFTITETFTMTQALVVTVERCGSHHRLRFGPLGSWAANSRVIVWGPGLPRRGFAGARLADGRRFVVPVPRAIRRLGSWSFYLTDRRLYVLATDTGQTWSAAAPR